MKITSTAFENGGLIPVDYTCDRPGNKMPPLTFDAVPPEAKSLALIVEDPDAPADKAPGGIFDHLVAFNIPPKTVGVKEVDTTVPGTYGINSAGQASYMQPCPPADDSKEHRYFFRLYALDTQLALKKGVSKADVTSAMDGHVIAKAELMGKYSRAQGQA